MKHKSSQISMQQALELIAFTEGYCFVIMLKSGIKNSNTKFIDVPNFLSKLIRIFSTGAGNEIEQYNLE